MALDYRSIFAQALPYQDFLARHATPEQAARWQGSYSAMALTTAQRSLLRSFRRQMNVLCLAGTWCGDCVASGPIIQRISEASPAIDVRFVQRAQRFDPQDGSPETALAVELSICGAPRVPMLLFLSEDWYECGRFGDRTLATYRARMSHGSAAWCPTGLVPPTTSLQETSIQEWVDQFERIQWMLATSPRLMQLHGEM